MITGKGGVGKSTLSVALANALSERGKTILYYPAENPSPSYELLNHTVVKYPLDFEREAREYVKLKLKFFLFWFPLTRSGVFRVFSKVIPGFRELIMLGRMWYDWSRGASDFYVFDGLPVGQMLSFLKIPQAGLSSGVGGPAKSDFEKMYNFVRKVKIIITTIPEQLPYEETVEMVEVMGKEGFSPYVIFLNRFWRRRLSHDDRKWIDYILTEGKLRKRERKELQNLMRFDEFFSSDSEYFLSMYKEISDVLCVDYFPLGVDRKAIENVKNIILQSSLFSHLF